MSGEFESQVLPHDLDSERLVLGAVLLQGELLDLILPTLRPEHFYRAAHQEIYRAMGALHERGVEIDLPPLRDRLAATGKLEDPVGGPAYLAALVDTMPRSAHVEQYAATVRDKATRRDVIRTARRMLADAYGAEDTTADVVDAAQAKLFKIAEQQVAGGFVTMPALMGEVLQELEDRQKGRGVSGVPSGFRDLDDYTGGFQPGDLVIVAARPSMGKSALMQSIAVHAATAGGAHVALFSVEMSRKSLGVRLVASEAGIDLLRLRDGRIYEPEWPAITQAIGRIGESKLHIDDSADVTVASLRAKARQLQAEHGSLGLIVVDYLQLMRSADRAENKNLEVAAISRGLKVVARDLNVPVVVLSQLSRDCEKRADKTPMLSDLRDSGALEQDADVVLFIHREEYYTPTDENHGEAHVIIAKQRNGPTATVRLAWRAHLTRFENAARV